MSGNRDKPEGSANAQEPGDTSSDAQALVGVLQAVHVFTLSSVSSTGDPYATPLFYAVARPWPPILTFASDPATRHGRDLGQGPTRVAAAIYGPNHEVSKLVGLQLKGDVWPADRGPEATAARAAYLTRHPVARPLLEGNATAWLYTFQVSWAKLTHNARLGLGQHRTWTFKAGSATLETAGV